MGNLFRDFRYGWRTLIKARGFTAGAVLTLALGIGANGTIFSWIDSTLLNPIPGVTGTAGLTSLSRGGTSLNNLSFSYLDYVDLRDRNQSLQGLIAFSIHPMSLTGTDKPVRVWGTTASANYFSVLGLTPILGRGFLPAEEEQRRGSPVVVISYGLWQEHFGGVQSIIGRTMNINHHPYTIIGVTPRLFQGSQTGLRSDLWIPVTMEQDVLPGADLCARRNANWLLLEGRLKPGITEQRAEQELSALMQQIAVQFPDIHLGSNSIMLFPLWRSPQGANDQLHVALPMLLAIAGIVLLLACANVANLLLVRSMGRRREIAIRLSVGAGRWRLVRQLLVESLLLALGGGVAAIVFVFLSAGSFTAFLPPSSLPLSMKIHVDASVLLVVLGTSVLTSFIFGILPALQLSRLAPVEVLKEETGTSSPGKGRLASSLVVVQIGLSLLLLICAGLAIRSFANSMHFNPGFDPDHVALGAVDLFPAGYTDANGKAFERELITKFASQPGVQSASLSTWVPLQNVWRAVVMSPEGYVAQRHESMEVGSAEVAPNYFQTMKIAVLDGREFSTGDSESSQPVIVVNRALADRYWPQQSAVGKKLGISSKSFTVVGVVANSNYASLGEPIQPFVYLPLFQDYDPSVIIHVRLNGSADAFAPFLERTVHELDSTLPVFDSATLRSRVQAAAAERRIAGTLVGAFGVVALILAAVGIYGVVAHTTQQRFREIGIRLALGAPQTHIFRMVLGSGLRLTGIGLLLGMSLSLAGTRFLGQLLFVVSATDPFTFAGVALVLSLVAMAACYAPARRAMRVDPLIVLRNQ